MFGMCADLLWFKHYDPWLSIIHSTWQYQEATMLLSSVTTKHQCLYGNDPYEARRKSY